MIIFLYGPDTYRLKKKLREIIEHYEKIHKSGLNLKYIDFQKDSFQDLKEILQSTPMLAEKKLIILQNIFSSSDFVKELLEQAEIFLKSKDIILFQEEKEIKRTHPLFQFLKKHGESQEFKFLEYQQLKNWVKKEFEKEKVRIDLPALHKLIDFLGNDLWQQAQEIKKLTAYKIKEKNPVITTEDIELLVRPKIELDIFKTIDFLASRNKKRTLSLIHQHLEKGDPPLYLLSLINFQFRNLLLIKSKEESLPDMRMIHTFHLSRELGLHPYVIKKIIKLTKKFSLEELKKIYKKIFQVDLAIKTGKTDPETALDMFIAEI